jgi:hypothetical protein
MTPRVGKPRVLKQKYQGLVRLDWLDSATQSAAWMMSRAIIKASRIPIIPTYARIAPAHNISFNLRRETLSSRQHFKGLFRRNTPK